MYAKKAGTNGGKSTLSLQQGTVQRPNVMTTLMHKAYPISGLPLKASKNRTKYTYDASGNRLTRANQTDSAMNESYTYDNLDRLTSMTRGSGTYSQTWTLDQAGNQSAVSTTANGTTTSQTETNDASNEITSINNNGTPSQPTYDLAGNMTFDGTDHYVYDAWNRMTAVYADNSGQPGTVIATYSYDGTSRRIAETVGSGQSAVATNFYFNGTAVVQTVATSGSTTTTNDYVWETNGLAPVARIGASQTLYFTLDANNNVTGIIDAATGAVIERYYYSAYGIQSITSADYSATYTVSSVANQFGFGCYWQEGGTSLDRSQTRLYDTITNTWTSPDLAGYIDTTNLEQYCDSHPVDGSDPIGDTPLDAIEKKFKGLHVRKAWGMSGQALAQLETEFDAESIDAHLPSVLGILGDVVFFADTFQIAAFTAKAVRGRNNTGMQLGIGGGGEVATMMGPGTASPESYSGIFHTTTASVPGVDLFGLGVDVGVFQGEEKNGDRWLGITAGASFGPPGAGTVDWDFGPPHILWDLNKSRCEQLFGYFLTTLMPWMPDLEADTKAIATKNALREENGETGNLITTLKWEAALGASGIGVPPLYRGNPPESNNATLSDFMDNQQPVVAKGPVVASPAVRAALPLAGVQAPQYLEAGSEAAYGINSNGEQFKWLNNGQGGYSKIYRATGNGPWQNYDNVPPYATQ
jgi:RHS repeat-associated protein